MTVIVGLVYKNTAYLGGDSSVTLDGTQVTNGSSKVFKSGKAIIGVCGSDRYVDILHYGFTMPEQGKLDTNTFMRTTFIMEIKEALKLHGYNDYPETSKSLFLVAYDKKIWIVEEDFAVLEADKYGGAVGCGNAASRGSLYTSYALSVENPMTRLELALKAGENIHHRVRSPFNILTMEQ